MTPYPSRPPHPSVVTIGTGEIVTQPDLVFLHVGVMTEGSDVKQSSTENARRAKNVLNALQQIGIPSEHIETANYNIQPVYDYQEGKSFLQGFRVEHIFKVRLQDAQTAGIVYDAAIRNGANVAGELSFELQHPERFYYDALQKAYVEAYQKAHSLALRMCVNLSRAPFRVVEMPQQQNGLAYKATMLQAASTPIQPQRVTVIVSVKAWFHFS